MFWTEFRFVSSAEQSQFCSAVQNCANFLELGTSFKIMVLKKEKRSTHESTIIATANIGLFGFKKVSDSEEVGKCHFALTLCIQTPEKENGKTLFSSLFSFTRPFFHFQGATINFVVM